MTASVDPASLIAASAANLAAWHEANLSSLGYTTYRVDGAWLTTDRVPGIFFSAIALGPGADAGTIAARVPQDAWVAISDPWGDLDLATRGFSSDGDHPWMVREPGAHAALPPTPPELAIERVLDGDALADFELASAAGFGTQPVPRFSWHAPAFLADPRLRIWRGRVDGRTVAGSMSFVDAGVVAVYSVSTMPEERRRGYGAALTWAALEAGPALPAVLQPSAMAEPLYRRLGFERFADFRGWSRAAIAPPLTDDGRP